MPKTGLSGRIAGLTVVLTIAGAHAAYGCTNTAGSTGYLNVDGSGAAVVPSPGPAPGVSSPLSRPVAGSPLFDRISGHVPTGFNLGSISTGRANARVTARVVADMGGTIGRQAISWKGIQPNRNLVSGACAYDWRGPDLVYEFLLMHGVRPLWVVADAPQWANTLGGCTNNQSQCSMPPDAAHVIDYVDLLRAIAQRYPLSAAVEVWNEPNMGRYWKTPDPVAYDQLLHAAWDGMQSSYPAMRVLGGALSPIPYDTQDQSGRPIIGLSHFLDQMQADGAFAWMHGFSFHPYPGQPNPDIFKATFTTLASYSGLADTRLFPDELGIPTSVQATVWSEHDQCAQLVDEFNWMNSGAPDLLPGNALWAHVDGVLFHTETQKPGVSSDGYGFGDIRDDYQPPLASGLPPVHELTTYWYKPRPVYLEFQRAFAATPPTTPSSSSCGTSAGPEVEYPANSG